MNQLTNFGLIGTAHAQTNGGLSLNSFSNLFSFSTTNLTAATLIGFVIQLIILVAGFAAFIYLVIAGFQYITAGGDAEKATKARTGIINAIIGIVVIVLAYAIVKYAAGTLAGNVSTGGTIQ